MTKITGSRSISQRHGSADPDPDPPQNVMDPEHCLQICISILKPVFRIRIHMFLGLPDPDPLVRGMDPDPALDLDPDASIIMQK
jgi:hypothetical protein